SGGPGQAKMSVTGKGDPLLLPAAQTPLPLPLIVELQSETGACWEGSFSAPASNNGTKFKAKSDWLPSKKAGSTRVSPSRVPNLYPVPLSAIPDHDRRALPALNRCGTSTSNS